MLTELLLLIFDTALYFTVFGFWFRIIIGSVPPYAGFLLLCAMIAAHVVLSANGRFGAGKKSAVLLLAIPAAGAAILLPAAGPAVFSPAQAAFMIPAAGYLVYCFIKGITDIDLPNFRDHFRTGALILLVMLPGIAIASNGLTALSEVAPYLIIMLGTGVIQLRNLRDGGTHKAWHGACIAAAMAAGWVLTVLHAPRAVGRILLLIYNGLIAPLLYAFAVAFAYLFAWLFELLRKLREILDIRNPDPGYGDNEYMSPEQSVIDIKENVISSHLIDYIGIALVVLIAAAGLIIVFRRLAARRDLEYNRSKTAIRSRSRLSASEADGGPSARLFRPRDPRLAVRYYYGRFLREALRRGVDVDPDLTGSEIERRSRAAFTGGADGGGAGGGIASGGGTAGGAAASGGKEADELSYICELYEIYSPARYSGHSVTEADVRRMRAALKKLK